MAKRIIQQSPLPFPPEKLCSRCKQIKPTTEFSKDGRYKDGLFCWCRYCHARWRKAPHPPKSNHVLINDIEHKPCRNCRRPLPLSRFDSSKNARDGLDGRCKECVAAYKRARYAHPARKARLSRASTAWHRTQKGKDNDYHSNIRQRYGVSREQYEALFAAQGGLCAICQQPPTKKRLGVDHDHKTGQIRGLVCTPHNVAIGLFNEDIQLLNNAIEYLKKHK